MNEQSKTKKPQAIVSAVLDDGSIVETVVSPGSLATGLLRVAGGERVSEGQSLDLPGLGPVRSYSPENSLLAHGVIRFPTTLEGYESEGALLAGVRRFIHRYADLSESFEEVASHYVLLSWVFDAFNELPYLRLKGDFGSGKTRCLQTIGSLCYKAMFASGASTVSPLFRIIDSFRGTLVLDESDFRQSDERAEIVKILNNGNAKGFPVLRSEATPTKEFSPKAFDVYGPKVIATRRSFDDRALESRCITEDLTGLPPRQGIPVSLPEAFHTESQRLRNQLLSYRSRWRGRVKLSPDQSEQVLEPRTAQIFGPLLAVAVDEAAREHLRILATEASRLLQRDRGTSIEAQLLDIMEELRTERAPLGIKEIAERFNTRFGNEARRAVTPRWIGAQLRSRLSINTVKSNGTFVVPRSDDPRLDVLCERYGVVRGSEAL